MKALRNLNESGANKNPFVYPGMVVKTSKTRAFPMEQLILQKWSGDAPTTGRRSAASSTAATSPVASLSFEGELRLPLVVSRRARPDP